MPLTRYGLPRSAATLALALAALVGGTAGASRLEASPVPVGARGTGSGLDGEAVARALERGTSPSARASADRAVARLASHVRQLSADDALRLAFTAYFSYAEAHPEDLRNPYLFFVDYGLDNRTARGYVFDMEALTLVDGPFTVAHGSGSSTSRNTVPTRFSNRPGSYMSSLGLYLTQETYGFSGKSAGRRYASVGLRLKGVSGAFNDAARRRGIVSHGAPYVTAGDAGRSQGCPAMEQHRAKRLLPMIANGGLVFLYSPRDNHWLQNGPWVSGV